MNRMGFVGYGPLSAESAAELAMRVAANMTLAAIAAPGLLFIRPPFLIVRSIR
jgi:hypothetical protein